MEDNNPFNYGTVIEDPEFFNRVSERQELRQDFLNGQNVILMSSRRYGKTSLVKKVAGELPSRTHAVCFVDLFKVSSPKRLIEVYSGALSLAISNKMEEMARYIKEWIPSLVPKITISNNQMPEFGIDFAGRPENLGQLIEKLFDLPEQIARKKKKKLLVIMDEFQDIVSLGDPGILRTLRACIQHQSNVSYCFMGSKRHMIEELFMKKSQPLYHCGRIMTLEKMRAEDLAVFIKDRFKRTGKKIPPELVDQIIQITRCQIYYVQMLCYALWSKTGTSTIVEATDLTAAIDQVINNQQQMFVSLWDALTSGQKNLMIALVKEGHSHLQTGSLVQHYDLGSTATVSKSLRLLTTREVLERENSEYYFADVFFGLWIRRDIL